MDLRRVHRARSSPPSARFPGVAFVGTDAGALHALRHRHRQEARGPSTHRRRPACGPSIVDGHACSGATGSSSSAARGEGGVIGFAVRTGRMSPCDRHQRARPPRRLCPLVRWLRSRARRRPTRPRSTPSQTSEARRPGLPKTGGGAHGSVRRTRRLAGGTRRATGLTDETSPRAAWNALPAGRSRRLRRHHAPTASSSACTR